MEAIRTPLNVLNAFKTPEKSGISSLISNPFLDKLFIAFLKTFLTSESTGTRFKSSLIAIDIGPKSLLRDSIKSLFEQDRDLLIHFLFEIKLNSHTLYYVQF